VTERLESISALFPAYNDEATIAGLVEKTFRLLEASGRDFEILVVDDGSMDATPQVLEQMQAQYGSLLRVIRHPANQGYGAAIRSGFANAAKDLVFYTDGDAQYDPGELVLLLERLEPSIGLVNGYKIKRSDPFYRVLLGKIYNILVLALFRLPIRDVDCDFRLMRRSLLVQTNLQAHSGVICAELLRELQLLGCRMVDIPVHHYPRVAGRSQFFRWRNVVATLWQLAWLYFRKPAKMKRSSGEGGVETTSKCGLSGYTPP